MRIAALILGILSGPAFAASNAAPAPAPAPAASGCTSPESKQLDFWLGDWNWTDTQGGRGTNHITRTYDGCVTEEHFETTGGPLNGHSVSTYHVPTKQWKQTWVDNQGGYIPLTGGPDGDKFVLTTLHLPDKPATSRMVFENIKHESFTWRWQGSSDGKTWADKWVINYTRKK